LIIEKNNIIFFIFESLSTHTSITGGWFVYYKKKTIGICSFCRHKILPSGKGWKVLYGLFLICGFWATIKTKVEEKKCVALNFNKIKC
jgi:hypothetical protein